MIEINKVTYTYNNYVTIYLLFATSIKLNNKFIYLIIPI